VALRDGDFLREVPSGGDLYVLCQVLHDWPDDKAALILAAIAKAAEPGARLVVVEPLAGDGPPSPADVLDLFLLTSFGGRLRRHDEHVKLAGEHGWVPVGRGGGIGEGRLGGWRLVEFARAEKG
jgi:hypothetical protein